VSSTYTDLREERQAAVEAILTAGHIPAGMELFAAGDETQMNVINRQFVLRLRLERDGEGAEQYTL
jgi:hypothetical protein